MAPKKKPEPELKIDDGKVTLPFIGTVSFRTAALILLFFSTDMGQRMLDRWGLMTAQSTDISEIRRDVSDIKKQVATIKSEVEQIKSLADVKKAALESVVAK